MAITGEYVPSPSEWVRNQVETIESTGTTDSVDIMGLPVVMLTMRGAKTSAIRKVPLMRVEHDGSFAAVASQGGAPTHPNWYHNLLAHPDIDLQAGTETFPVHAREPRGRGARAVVGAVRRGLPALRGVPDEDRPPHPRVRARAPLTAGAGAGPLTRRLRR